MRLVGPRVAVEVPRGWDAEIYQPAVERPLPEPDGSPGEALDPGSAPIILHAANFPLPPVRSDFGHDLIGQMSLMQLFVALIEYGPDDAGKVLFAHEGVPDLDVDDLSPGAIMSTSSGQAAVQRFFHVGDRAFSLYVAVGSHRLRSRIVPAVKDFLETIELD